MDWIRNALEIVLVTAQKIFTIIIMLFITIKNTKREYFKKWAEIYTYSALNNSNEIYTFMCPFLKSVNQPNSTNVE